MSTSRPAGVLRRFFAGLTEHAFHGRLGVADPALVDYISDLLVRFVRTDIIYRFRDLDGVPLEEVAGLMAEGEQRVGEARRQVHRHIGDFTLFWTGVYPEAVARLRSPMRRDHLIDYREQGKRSYQIASTVPPTGESDDRPVFRKLSEQFELCAYGLGEIRREWERRDLDSAQAMLVD